MEGLEYTNARNLANSTNVALRRSNPSFFKDFQIHEITPIKFGGSPTDLTNKLFLTHPQHVEYSNFWRTILSSAKNK